jgi:hypothetical protein
MITPSSTLNGYRLDPPQKTPSWRGVMVRSDSGTNSIPRCSTANARLSPTISVTDEPPGIVVGLVAYESHSTAPTLLRSKRHSPGAWRS